MEYETIENADEAVIEVFRQTLEISKGLVEMIREDEKIERSRRNKQQNLYF